MMGIDVGDFSAVEQTALLTQYARALDSRWPRPILGDTLADEIVAKIDYDFTGLGVPTSVVCQAALRAKMLDDRVRDFTAQRPDAVVVDLGARSTCFRAGFGWPPRSPDALRRPLAKPASCGTGSERLQRWQRR
jgi:hypothetical protein